MIGVITEKARAMMIDSQAPLEFWGEAVDTAVYLYRLTPNEGLTKRDDRDGYKAAYETPYEMLHAYDKPAIDANGKKISYKVPPLPATIWLLCQSIDSRIAAPRQIWTEVKAWLYDGGL